MAAANCCLNVLKDSTEIQEVAAVLSSTTAFMATAKSLESPAQKVEECQIQITSFVS